MKPALLVIDVQKAFYQSGPVVAELLTHAIDYINAAIDLFRRRRLPVAVIQHMNPNTGLLPGSEGFAVPEAVKHLPTDLWVTKTYGNSFTKTNLAATRSSLRVTAPSTACF